MKSFIIAKTAKERDIAESAATKTNKTKDKENIVGGAKEMTTSRIAAISSLSS